MNQLLKDSAKFQRRISEATMSRSWCESILECRHSGCEPTRHGKVSGVKATALAICNACADNPTKVIFLFFTKSSPINNEVSQDPA